jgi:hypothetical protein
MKKIFIAGLIAGTLDAIAAVLFSAKQYTLHSIAGVFRFISRGVFGNSVAPNGALYPIIGLILHYLIATVWAAFYILVLFKTFKPGALWAKVILFGCTVWTIMNGLVLPAVGLTMIKYDGFSIMKAAAIILICISLPICLIAEKKGMKV